MINPAVGDDAGPEDKHRCDRTILWQQGLCVERKRGIHNCEGVSARWTCMSRTELDAGQSSASALLPDSRMRLTHQPIITTPSANQLQCAAASIGSRLQREHVCETVCACHRVSLCVRSAVLWEFWCEIQR